MKIKQLQQMTLNAQGLTQVNSFGKGKKAVLASIEQLGYIQIDTLSVVESAHHHTLWTRVSDYKPEYLEQLVKDRDVFEYWFHAASYLPIKDFRFALPQMNTFKRGEASYYNKVDPKILSAVRDRIVQEGPLKARDFKSNNKKSGSWWDWKPAKVALEKLFLQGDIMIAGRNGMEKVYDLTERVLPSHINTTEPSPLEFAKYLTNTYLRAYGVTSLKQICHLKSGKILRNNVEMVLQNLIDENKVQTVDLEDSAPIYLLNSALEISNKKKNSNIQILSPFDNLVIHRDRLKQLFEFDYKMECYTPKVKRKFGYFCLPVLLNNAFIGRIDCKAHRKTGQFEVISIHLENKVQDIDVLKIKLLESLKQFALFNNCQTIVVSQRNQKGFVGELIEFLMISL